MITVKKIKDPDATLDYRFRWTKELDPLGDTIVSSTIVADPGITVVSSSFSETEAVVWLSGGTAGKRYTVTNRITTSGGRTYDRSFYLHIAQL